MPDTSNKVLTAEQLESLRKIKVPRWIYVLLIYCIAVAFFQGGGSKAVSVYLAALALSVSFTLLLAFTDLAKKPVRLLAGLLVLTMLIWFHRSESYRCGFALIWDILAIPAGGYVVVVLAGHPSRLFVVAEPDLDGATADYLARLRDRFGLQLEYLQVRE